MTIISERLLRSAAKAGARWTFSVLFAAFILALSFAQTDIQQLLRYDRVAIVHGQWYRLLTGNLVHLDWKHALLNCSGLLLLPTLTQKTEPIWLWLWRVMVLALGVGLGLFVLSPQLDWYVGLSGVLHGLYVLALGGLAFQRDYTACTVLLILIGKVVWEHYHGSLQFSQSMVNAPIIVAAHSYGVITAMVYAVVAWAVKRRLRTEPAD